ncbi:hypothetical protein A1O3_01393 [Capronia epimyces CBS 606.96]|uniref:Uncharacterized protein n=1 Tax=Capronia epimyces CBS 606.96 TaxID=1182542 RepID=W9ZED4_9EURO|nr:uncharacterized protein A1O3_01393 [Capronia epimyces CBS 606.96]EXJ92839.1 hypothetical protein A1O3_01393 [Capronia epimyces CBS 606.96]
MSLNTNLDMDFNGDNWAAESSAFLAVGEAFLDPAERHFADDFSAFSMEQNFSMEDFVDGSQFVDAAGPCSSIVGSVDAVASNSPRFDTSAPVHHQQGFSGFVPQAPENFLVDDLDWGEFDWNALEADPELAALTSAWSTDNSLCFNTDDSCLFLDAEMSAPQDQSQAYNHQPPAFVDPMSTVLNAANGRPRQSSLVPPPLFSQPRSLAYGAADDHTSCTATTTRLGPEPGRPHQRLSVAPAQDSVLSTSSSYPSSYPSLLHLGEVKGLSVPQRPLPGFQHFQMQPLANDDREFTFTYPVSGPQPVFPSHDGSSTAAHSTATSNGASATATERKHEWRLCPRQTRSGLRERRQAKLNARARAEAAAAAVAAARASPSPASSTSPNGNGNANSVQGGELRASHLEASKGGVWYRVTSGSNTIGYFHDLRAPNQSSVVDSRPTKDSGATRVPCPLPPPTVLPPPRRSQRLRRPALRRA